MSTQHTAIPWKTLGSTQIIRDEGAGIIGETICECENLNSLVSDDARDVANAAFICRACNSHDALLAALRTLVIQIERSRATDDYGHPLAHLTALTDARAVLAAVDVP